MMLLYLEGHSNSEKVRDDLDTILAAQRTDFRYILADVFEISFLLRSINNTLHASTEFIQRFSESL